MIKEVVESFTTITMISTVLILAVCRTSVTYDLSYSAHAWCSEIVGSIPVWD